MISSARVTPRQREVIERLCEPGATQASVAEELGISTQTLKNHLYVAYRALGVRTLAQAAKRLRVA